MIAGGLWLMTVCGARRIDIARLRRARYTTHRVKKHRATSAKESKALTVDWCWTKGVRKIQHRRRVTYRVTYPLHDVCDAPKGLLKPDGTVTMPRGFTVNAVNKALKQMGFKMTTGSFRRLFAARIEEYCIANNVKKSELLVHKDESMDKAFCCF